MTIRNKRTAPETFDSKVHFWPSTIELPFVMPDGRTELDTVTPTIRFDEKDRTLVAVRTRTDWNTAAWVRLPARRA